MIVGVTGRAQHGKDSIGQRLVDSWGFARMGFADQLKELALEVDPVIPGEHLLINSRRLTDIVLQHGWEAAKRLYPEVRRFLQELGTGARDILGEDVWVRALEKRWLEAAAKDVVVTDVRFPNEADYIHRNGGVLVRVTRYGKCHAKECFYRESHPFDNGVDPNHPSERYVPSLPADYEVTNDGSLSDLNARVDAIAADLVEGFVR